MLPQSARRLLTAAVLAIASLSLAANAQASTITFLGTTTGCFGTNCSSFADTASSGGVSFDGNSFTLEITDATAPPTASIISGDFGSMFLNGSSIVGSDFTLKVTFTLLGTDNVFAQTSVVGGSGNAKVEWEDVLTTFSFANAAGAGGFSFLIDDQTLNRSGAQSFITPLFSAVTFTPADTQPAPAPTAPVPEPGSLLLLGSGLVLAASRMRRRKSS